MQRFLQAFGTNTVDFFKLWWTHRRDPTFWMVWGPPLFLWLLSGVLHGFWHGVAVFVTMAFFNHMLVYVHAVWCTEMRILGGAPGPAPKLFSFPTWIIFRVRFRFGGIKPGRVFARAYTLQEWNWGETAVCRKFDLAFWCLTIFAGLPTGRLLIWWIFT